MLSLRISDAERTALAILAKQAGHGNLGEAVRALIPQLRLEPTAAPAEVTAPLPVAKPAAVLKAVKAACKAKGLAFVPDLARQLGVDVRGALAELERAGKVELRPWSGGESMAPADAQLCPVQPAASSSQRTEPLAYVRLR